MLKALRVRGPDLFGDMAKKITREAAARQKPRSSLALIRPDLIRFHIFPDTWDGAGGTQPRFGQRVSFIPGGAPYELSLTDPVLKRRLRGVGIGSYSPADIGLPPGETPCLVCRLGEPYLDGCCYKLVASVLSPP